MSCGFLYRFVHFITYMLTFDFVSMRLCEDKENVMKRFMYIRNYIALNAAKIVRKCFCVMWKPDSATTQIHA